MHTTTTLHTTTRRRPLRRMRTGSGIKFYWSVIRWAAPQGDVYSWQIKGE